MGFTRFSISIIVARRDLSVFRTFMAKKLKTIYFMYSAYTDKNVMWYHGFLHELSQPKLNVVGFTKYVRFSPLITSIYISVGLGSLLLFWSGCDGSQKSDI